MLDELKDYDVVVLLRDLPDENLRAGHRGAIIMTHGQGEAFEVEFPITPRRSIVATMNRGDLLKLIEIGRSAEAEVA